jgi:TonB-linked SusC/RagA family outer membrane protein
MRKIRLMPAIIAFLFVAGQVNAQTAEIVGKITDSIGNGVQFATVTIKGSGKGLAADQSGNFKTQVSKGATLAISAAGFEPIEFVVENFSPITVSLKSNNLQEVVVTALGLKRTRNSVPYATQQVSGDDITKTLNTNFVENLSGKVSGLQITSSNTLGGSTNTILRGFKSLTQSNQALFVVDGVPYDNTNQSQNGFDLGNAAADINPEDIASVNVLKGAAASALYGSRASNGVILITTKKGTKKRGVGVTVTSGVTVGSPDKSTLPTYQTQYGEGYGSQGYDPAYPNQSGFFYYTPVFNSNGQPVQVVQTDVDAATGPAYNPGQLVYNWDAFVPGDPNYGKATPWQPAAHHNAADFFETPVTTSTSVYVDGGGEQTAFKTGFTRSEDKGILPNSNLVKTLLNFGGTHAITDNLTIGAQVNYSDIEGIGRDGYTYSSQQNPLMDFREWWPTNADIKQQKADYFNTHTNATWNRLGGYTDPSSLIVAYHNNPYWNRYQNSEDDSRKRYFGNVNLNYKINSWINLFGRVSTDDYNQFVEYHTAVGSVHQSSYSRYNITYGEVNYDLLLNINKNLTKDINLKALLGSNVRQVNNSSIFATTNGGLVVPGVYALANSVNTPAAPVETQSKKEVDGIFAGATLSFREFITLDATLRRDKSSTLPAANNTYYYPSISGNFVFSKLLNASWLSYGKLRANYAEVGGDAPVYSVKNTFQYVAPFNGEPTSAAPVTNNNANLLPEKNQTYEFGLEAAFLKNRIGFDVTYYNAKQIDQIMPISVSTSSGYSQYYVNGGTVQNQGVELSINLNPIRTKDFSWNVTVNWSKNVNKVLSLYNGQPSYLIANYGFNTQLVAEVGKTYGVIRGSDYTYKTGQ